MNLETAIRLEGKVDTAAQDIRALFSRYPQEILGRALARAIREAGLFEAPAEEPPHESAALTPRQSLPPDVQRWADERDRAEHETGNLALGRRGGLVGGRARAEALSSEERSEQARHAAVRRWDTSGQRVDAADDPSLVPLRRSANGAVTHAEEPVSDEPTGDVMLRRVLTYIGDNPGASLTTLRKNVQGRIEHISEALRMALEHGYTRDNGVKPRRELVLSAAGCDFLGRAESVPLPPRKGSKSEALESLLKQRHRVHIGDIAEHVYGSRGTRNENNARSLLHHLIRCDRAEKLDEEGMYGPCAAAATPGGAS